MRLFFAFFVSVNKKDKFSSFISTYGTVMKRGVLYYRTRIKDANGKLVAIYEKTPEELYNKETLALEQINLYCSRQRTIMYSVEVHNGLYDTKRGRRKMGRDTSYSKLLLRCWAYPRRCKDGWCLADPKERRKAD